MDEGATRTGQNEAWFRELNERLELQAANHRRARAVEAICDCELEECTEPITISFAEYERVRAHARSFVVARGHDDASAEQKLGAAAVVAERSDPREARGPS